MMYVSVDKKMNHLNTLKRQAAELERKIKQLEKELTKDMIRAYAEIEISAQ